MRGNYGKQGALPLANPALPGARCICEPPGFAVHPAKSVSTRKAGFPTISFSVLQFRVVSPGLHSGLSVARHLQKTTGGLSLSR